MSLLTPKDALCYHEALREKRLSLLPHEIQHRIETMIHDKMEKEWLNSLGSETMEWPLCPLDVLTHFFNLKRMNAAPPYESFAMSTGLSLCVALD